MRMEYGSKCSRKGTLREERYHKYRKRMGFSFLGMFNGGQRSCATDGSQTRFWEDLWLGKDPLMVIKPNLYNIVRKKNVSVAQVLSTTPLNVSFRCALVGIIGTNGSI
jgi:hypothetical protein